jgi:hypothetical protein
LRAPMSRMDVLNASEIEDLITQSKLVKKYNEVIDRESAYELLSKKMVAAQEIAQKAIEQKQEVKEIKTERKSTAQNPVIKVLTSASFIRGAMGVLMKFLKK